MPYVTSFERLAKEEGREEGRVAGLLARIEQALDLKFGADGLALLPEIQKVSDVGVLQAVLRGIKTTGSVEELRRLWS